MFSLSALYGPVMAERERCYLIDTGNTSLFLTVKLHFSGGQCLANCTSP